MTTKNSSYFEKLERQYGALSFGAFLKAWREADGITQSIFAKKLRLSVQNLNDLEKGRRIPSPTRAASIAKKLCIPEIGLIKLALRDSLFKDGFKYDVTLKAA
jgi:transcriptional regulator with XRE-family HTH domain